jgi:hypothetical protein
MRPGRKAAQDVLCVHHQPLQVWISVRRESANDRETSYHGTLERGIRPEPLAGQASVDGLEVVRLGKDVPQEVTRLE